MKKLSLILILLGTITEAALAQIRSSTVQIHLRNDKLLTVIMDGRHYKRYGRTITFGDVPAGTHDIKVYRYYPNDDPRYSESRPKAVLLYKGKMRIDPGTTYYCTVDPQYKTMSIRESREALYEERTYRIEEQTDFDEDRDDKSYDNDKDNDWNKDRNKTTYRDPNLLSSEQLNTLQSAVEERIGSNDKVSLIRNFLQTKKMTTAQVKTILEWLSFESSKLEIAKYCYPRTIDQDNYLQVGSLLSFQNSKIELEELMFKGNRKSAEPTNKVQNMSLSATQMNQLSLAVKEKITDTDRQKLMQKDLNDNTITTAQVGQMLDWLTFEGSKLEFAKWAYSKVSDKAAFHQLKSKFTFLSSKKAIDELILKK